jgi:hypothetical protein
VLAAVLFLRAHSRDGDLKDMVELLPTGSL